MSVSGGERRAVLEPLQSDTSYKVTVTPVYSDGQDGLGASAMGSTCKANKHTKCKAHTHTHTHPWLTVLTIMLRFSLFTTQRCSSRFRRILEVNDNEFHRCEQGFHLHCINFMFIYVLEGDYKSKPRQILMHS